MAACEKIVRRVALDAVTPESGAMRYLPYSHLEGECREHTASHTLAFSQKVAEFGEAERAAEIVSFSQVHTTACHVLRQAAARCSIVWSQAMLSSTTARPSTEPSRTSPTPPPAASAVRSAWCIAAKACALMRRRCRIMCRALSIRGCQAAGLCEKGRQGVPNDEPGCDSWKCGHEMCIPVICCHHPLAPAASTVGLRGQWLVGLGKTREANAR